MTLQIQKIIVFTSCCLAVAAAEPARADRQNTVSGSIAFMQGYDSNVNRTPTGEIDEWTSSLIPSLSFSSKGRQDSLNLTYSPSYKYNYRLDDGEFEHRIALAGDRALSDKLQLSVHDSFVKSDNSTLTRDETQDTSYQVNLTENLPRHKYWANFFDINNSWQYGPSNVLSFGYAYSIYDTDNLNQDYQSHAPRIDISHAFNRQWTVSAGYTFIKGDFEGSDDTRQHCTTGRLTYHVSPHRSIYGQGAYSSTDYTGTEIDYHSTAGLLGFSQQIDQDTALDVAAGYTSTKRDNGSETGAFDSSLSLTRKFEKGSFSLTGASGFNDQRFNGENDGLAKFWSAKSTLSYLITERLSSAIYALYQNDKFVEKVPEREDDSFEAGGRIDWSFARWYTAGIRYVFHKLDSSIAGDDYYDHQLFLTLSASKELWKW